MTYYRGKSAEQLTKENIPDQHKLKPKSIKTRVDNVRSFINWAENEGYITSAKRLNGALSLKKMDSKAKKSSRRAFTPEEIKMLFHSPQYTETASETKQFRRAWQFWLPLIALYTGARIEEICQLHLTDVRLIDDVWCFDINNEGDKELKTEASKRRVPVHPFLIETGLLNRIEALRNCGESHLFSRASLSHGGTYASATASKWFTRYRRDCGVGADAGEISSTTFHSFRHTFITWMKLNDIDRRKVKEVVGHEAGEFADVTGDYEGQYPTSTLLRDVIAPIDFHRTINLEHLKNNRWIQIP